MVNPGRMTAFRADSSIVYVISPTLSEPQSKSRTHVSKPSKMSKPKLTYFDVRARGELARLVFVAAKKDFEDVRIDFASWPALKAKSTYGTLPILELNGKEYFQGNAIATYLAREHGLYGSNNLEGLMIDQVVDLKEDLLQEEAKTMFGSDADKEAAAKKLPEEIYPRVMKIFAHCIKQNAAKSGFLVGKQLSLGDLAIFEASQGCSKNHPKILDDFPEIKTVREKVASADGVKQYLAKRKDTPI
ncbi:glutathione s-transferase [Plakobranchus ocellatus]|uniref:Glutathione s-transferase n=1 Tax=Plakobranchus ocellatus TaxID=259542 RepID=A0AAV3ZFW6_9GAST|nr:glutathione s-transferase [Plakobranchus ocellatus]